MSIRPEDDAGKVSVYGMDALQLHLARGHSQGVSENPGLVVERLISAPANMIELTTMALLTLTLLLELASMALLTQIVVTRVRSGGEPEMYC
ncbi:hypothetical protein RRG08_027040 [Elysia crispata]|uniref:Uncharacterized protein n=1 Tax=Elysia crispata TaxID=231223 RepID=A0AAE1DH10_9GAST|nr:hypothetical protein RRG08_027040 [Elysia crispata]